MLVADAGVDRLCIVADRVAAGAAVLRGLARRGAHVVAATHDGELADVVAEAWRKIVPGG